jgi:hypothetical protein
MAILKNTSVVCSHSAVRLPQASADQGSDARHKDDDEHGDAKGSWRVFVEDCVTVLKNEKRCLKPRDANGVGTICGSRHFNAVGRETPRVRPQLPL